VNINPINHCPTFDTDFSDSSLTNLEVNTDSVITLTNYLTCSDIDENIDYTGVYRYCSYESVYITEETAACSGVDWCSFDAGSIVISPTEDNSDPGVYTLTITIDDGSLCDI
jgi:hypothetical protein